MTEGIDTDGGEAQRAVYLAGPSGFTDAGRQWHYDHLVPAVVAAGLAVNDPWEPFAALEEALSLPEGSDRKEALWYADMSAGSHNASLIADSDAVLACLDGTDVDSGTAAEIGYGFGLGLIVVGLRTDFRLASDNEGTTVNLQVEYFIVESGGIVATTIDEAVQYLAESLTTQIQE
jgi:nucleoside 2-deoxyribosyltransferase